MWLCMCDLRQNWSFHVAAVEFRNLRLRVLNFWIQPSDSSIQALKISEGERDVWNIWILQGGGELNNAPLYEAV